MIFSICLSVSFLVFFFTLANLHPHMSDTVSAEPGLKPRWYYSYYNRQMHGRSSRTISIICNRQPKKLKRQRQTFWKKEEERRVIWCNRPNCRLCIHLIEDKEYYIV